MIRNSFLFERQSLWLWVSTVTIIIFTLLYFAHEPIGGRNGGTAFGIVAGCVAAFAMLFLMLYARRKRDYTSTFGTLKNWLSAHVWVGLMLIVLVPIHSGFQFGCNVHTLCYFFIIITILTGIWGTFLCISMPPSLEARREGLSSKGLFAEVNLLSSEIASLAKNKSSDFLKLINQFDCPADATIWKILFSKAEFYKQPDEKLIAKFVSPLNNEEQQQALKLISLIGRKINLTNKLYKEVKIFTLLKVWLYIHLPFAVGGFTLLLIHLFTVFYLW